ncbi:hypothetical protein HYQ46_009182 [Verticillium longisporum]|nr:hypothetical protein HYQ46_009182 [Verticillium longisporum]
MPVECGVEPVDLAQIQIQTTNGDELVTGYVTGLGCNCGSLKDGGRIIVKVEFASRGGKIAKGEARADGAKRVGVQVGGVIIVGHG